MNLNSGTGMRKPKKPISALWRNLLGFIINLQTLLVFQKLEITNTTLGIRKKYKNGLQVTFHGSGCIFKVAGREESLNGSFGTITAPKKLNIMPILKDHFIKIDIERNKRRMIYTVYIEELYLDYVKFIDLLKKFDLSLVEYLSQK